MFRFCVMLCLIFYFNFNGADATFPDDPKPCKYEDYECLAKTIEYFIHEKNQGDSSINLIKIDPLEVSKISLQQGAESPVNINMTFTNSELHGISKAKVKNVKGFGKDLTKKHGFTLTADQIDLVGDYTIKGRILVLPITGTGKSNITLLNLDANLEFNAKPLEKDGEVYMKIDKFHVELVPQRMIFKIDNLFNGDKELGDNMNLFLNENWSDIFKELKGTIGSAFAKIFKSVIGHVFTKYPYNKFLVE